MTTEQRRIDPANPYDYYHDLQVNNPVFQIQEGTWMITRYVDACQLLQDPRCVHWGQDLDHSSNMPDLERSIAATLFNLAPDHYAPYRKQIMHQLAAKSLSLDEEKMLQEAQLLVEKLKSKTELDFIEDFAHPFTFGIISRIIGIPENRRESLSNLVSKMDGGYLACIDNKSGHLTADGNLFIHFLQDLIALKKEQPGNDLCSALLSSSSDEKDQEVFLLSMLVLLLYAGHQNMMNFFGNAILAMHAHMEAQNQFRESEKLLEKSIDEIIRYDSPLQYIILIAKEDFYFGEHFIHKGNQLMIAVGAANRDADAFDRPDQLMPGRQPKHLGFGIGAFRCIGARLAQMEAFLGLNVWLQNTESYFPIQEQIKWRTNPYVQRGPSYLPMKVKWTGL
ncbi:MAG: cytochrome P450 [Saprospiraceae bacterium]